jgi:hypothetical protein
MPHEEPLRASTRRGSNAVLTDLGGPQSKPVDPAILPADVQQAVWFRGTPAGFDAFTHAVGTPAVSEDPPIEAPPAPAELARMAARYGIEILGPAPIP